jgi:predicted Zn-dependent peptidase
VAYRDGGLFVIYAGMSPQAGAEVIRLTLAEVEKMKLHPVDETELRRAKESLKGGLMLGLESTGSRMSMLARSQIYHGRQVTLDELIAKVDAVTATDVQEMAADLFAPGRLSMAAIGPFRTDGQLTTAMRGAFERVEAKA